MSAAFPNSVVDTPQTVLVVDDDPDVVELIDLAIGQRYRLVVAHGPELALAVLEETSVDAILADVFMPVMDGIAFLREVQARGIDVPCLLLSAEPPAHSTLGVSIFGTIRKPCNVGELVGMFERALSRAE